MEQRNKTDQMSTQLQENIEEGEEESGWTSYFDYYFKSNKCLSSCSSESPSMLSDASSTSAAAWKSKTPSKKNPQGCNQKSKPKTLTDEGLKDTASSPKRK